MSKKAATQFLDRLEKDPTFRAELLKLKTDKERRDTIARLGFRFNEKEYHAAYFEKYNSPIDEKELRAVIGKDKKQMPAHLCNMHADEAKIHVGGRLTISDEQ